jgi:hypothetical protein
MKGVYRTLTLEQKIELWRLCARGSIKLLGSGPHLNWYYFYIDWCVAIGEVLIRKFTDQTYIFLNYLSLLLHLLNTILASLVLKSLQNILILLNNLD